MICDARRYFTGLRPGTMLEVVWSVSNETAIAFDGERSALVLGSEGAHSYTDLLLPVLLGPATHRMVLISTLV